ncbi:hypothetical protein Vadar_019930 [Vaccinium darrowii]|uniref:Uncharacterized protein n=1 Tax=Vaccinium darrowii TaxID=229202 RepID=A0ACB7XS57_9ERIC|nr:hypothetical protein Vadar_019930 [Vaccinium darrowii]
MLLLGFSLILWNSKRKQRQKGKSSIQRIYVAGKDLLSFDLGTSIGAGNNTLTEARKSPNTRKKEIDLPRFSFASVSAATDDFSDANKLGEGGFGPVYKKALHIYNLYILLVEEDLNHSTYTIFFLLCNKLSEEDLKVVVAGAGAGGAGDGGVGIVGGEGDAAAGLLGFWFGDIDDDDDDDYGGSREIRDSWWERENRRREGEEERREVGG